ncbi:MAG: RpiB/LacA/LacB family sugar-phosphate isomerase [Treponema sp.]
MKIGVIQADSQKDKNELLFNCTKTAVSDSTYEVINFGIFAGEEYDFSYIQTALCISFLLESKAVDFIVTGCSSGQGMMLACNSLPGIVCGYTETVSDAFLFGRINNGNVLSYPLGLSFGWAAEINLQNVLNALFKEPFGTGYPAAEAERKRKDAEMLKTINKIAKKSLPEVISELDKDFVRSVFRRKIVFLYVLEHGKDRKLADLIRSYM